MSWRGRLGIIYPADGALDDEYWRLLPPGMTVHFTRIAVSGEEVKAKIYEEQARSSDIEQAAGDLTIIRPSAIAYACTTGSFIRGVGGDLDIIDRIEAATDVPGTTTSTAAVRALRALDVSKLAVVTPYAGVVNERLHSFLADSGFDVVSFQSLELTREIFLQPAGAAYWLARETDVPEAEAIFIACTNFRTLEVLDALEQDLGKPVVSANQATVWDMLRLAGISPNLEGRGTLYRLKKETHRE